MRNGLPCSKRQCICVSLLALAVVLGILANDSTLSTASGAGDVLSLSVTDSIAGSAAATKQPEADDHLLNGTLQPSEAPAEAAAQAQQQLPTALPHAGLEAEEVAQLPSAESMRSQRSGLQFPRLPNHIEGVPGRPGVVRPAKYKELPALSDDLWESSLKHGHPDLEAFHAILFRLLNNKSITIQVQGGSMTFGEGCCVGIGEVVPATRETGCAMKFGECAWPAQFADSLHQAFPGAAITVQNLGRGGCDLECALPELIIRQTSGEAAPDMLVLDFGQNGWGNGFTKVEQFVRVCHLFMPRTLLVFLANKDMQGPLNNHQLPNQLKAVVSTADHYSLPVLSFFDAMWYHIDHGGKLQEIWPGGATHHPTWPAHAYYADMFAWWFNKELRALESYDNSQLQGLDSPDFLPQALKPADLSSDKSWIKQKQKFDLAENACLFPLTAHVARNPGASTPLSSPKGDWRLYEDRRNKPGWITNKSNGEELAFNVTFSKEPKLAIAYLRSYENVGSVDVKVQSSLRWRVKQPSGQWHYVDSWNMRALWKDRLSITQNALYKAQTPSEKEFPIQATVTFRLSQPPKFKLISVISC